MSKSWAEFIKLVEGRCPDGVTIEGSEYTSSLMWYDYGEEMPCGIVAPVYVSGIDLHDHTLGMIHMSGDWVNLTFHDPDEKLVHRFNIEPINMRTGEGGKYDREA